MNRNAGKIKQKDGRMITINIDTATRNIRIKNQFVESEHPRDSDGKFTSGGGGGGTTQDVHEPSHDYIEKKIYRVLTADDKLALKAYAEYYGLTDKEINDTAELDSFIEECFHYDERTDQMELNDADDLPFAEKVYSKGNWDKYTWNGQTVMKPSKAFKDAIKEWVEAHE